MNACKCKILKDSIVKAVFLILTATLNPQITIAQDVSHAVEDFDTYKWLNLKLPLDTLVSYNHDTLALFQNDYCYVFTFWSTNCSPCLAEIEWLNQLKNSFQNENVKFIAISYDQPEEIATLLEKMSFNFVSCFLPIQILNRKRLAMGYPTHVITDSKGIVRFQKSGGSTAPEKAGEIYDILLEQINLLRD